MTAVRKICSTQENRGGPLIAHRSRSLDSPTFSRIHLKHRFCHFREVYSLVPLIRNVAEWREAIEDVKRRAPHSIPSNRSAHDKDGTLFTRNIDRTECFRNARASALSGVLINIYFKYFNRVLALPANHNSA